MINSITGFLAVLPPSASTVAPGVDHAFWWVTIISVVSFILVEAALILFVIKYRRKKGEADKPTLYITHHKTAEIIWTVIPSILLLVIFYYGAVSYIEMRTLPKEYKVINIKGQKWAWEMTYAGEENCIRDVKGKEHCLQVIAQTKPNEYDKNGENIQDTDMSVLRVPTGQNYRLIMTSKDVLHSFYIPAFRIKQDVVPGLNTWQWFQATEAGAYPIFCTEYCGTSHYGMMGRVLVMETGQFNAWREKALERLKEEADALAAGGDDPVILAKAGEKLFNSNACGACHSMEGTRVVGPALNGIYGKERVFADGSKVAKADYGYIKESILNPGAKIVEGYPAGVMPKFALNEGDLKKIAAYLQTSE